MNHDQPQNTEERELVLEGNEVLLPETEIQNWQVGLNGIDSDSGPATIYSKNGKWYVKTRLRGDDSINFRNTQVQVIESKNKEEILHYLNETILSLTEKLELKELEAKQLQRRYGETPKEGSYGESMIKVHKYDVPRAVEELEKARSVKEEVSKI